MCGILAVISEDNEPNEYYEKMQQKLLHRGPDYQSKYKEKSYNSIITLIHNRLVIRELSELGNQPYRYKEFILIFNGEIYNTDELKNRINKKILKGNSDTEILINLYSKYKTKIMDMIDGMY